MHTGIPVDIGKCLLILATAGEEVIGDVITQMVKDGLQAVGEDDQLIKVCPFSMKDFVSQYKIDLQTRI
jgi:hypothetical protein